MSTIPETDIFSPVVVGPYTLSNRLVMALI